MNKINKFIFGFVGLALFAGCSDLTGSKTSDLQENAGYIVNGNLSFGSASGAVPSQFVSYASSARTATASFSDDIAWEISATKGDKSYAPLNYTSGSTFSFLFDEAGEYTIEARAVKDDTIIASGSEKVSVIEKETSSITITARPKYTRALGSVNLAMDFDSSVAERIASVEVEWIGLEDRTMSTMEALGYDREAANIAEQNGEAYTPPAEVQAAMEAFDMWQESWREENSSKTIPVSGTSATIAIDGIFCGAHAVQFYFNDYKGNTLYSCKEMINVYSGFTTDTWYGTAPYINDGKFKLTWKAVVAYGVAKDNPVLFNYDSNTYIYKNTNGEKIITADSLAFDLDALGSVWAFTNFGTTTLDITTDSLVLSENLQIYVPEMKMLSELKIDRENDILYTCFTEAERENTLLLTAYDKLIKEGNPESETRYTITFTKYTDFSCKQVAVHDNNVYVIGLYDNEGTNEYYFMTVNLADADLSYNITSDSEGINLNLNEKLDGINKEPDFTDMLYQDGCVYFLVKDNDYDSLLEKKSCNSRGAVIKVNPNPKPGEEEVTAKGWTAGALNSADTKVYTCFNSNILVTEKTLKRDPSKWKPFSNKNYCEFYSPDIKNNSESFYGAQKFIAIKPKKLVIADSGIAFYTDSKDAWRLKNIHRIIEVDLEKFSITSAKDISSKFTYGKPNGINTCGFISIEELLEGENNDANIWVEKASSFYTKSQWVDEMITVGLAIPCDDEE